jgi:hypothetical protein
MFHIESLKPEVPPLGHQFPKANSKTNTAVENEVSLINEAEWKLPIEG